jgi:hypothetical protein
MTTFNQIGPWITAAVLFVVVIFFCVFYLVRFFQSKKSEVPVQTVNPKKHTSAQKQQLKETMIHDIVADITPVLEKRLEGLY